jgi:hypothetical protein
MKLTAQAQLETFYAFKRMHRNDLIHIAEQAGLEPTHYNTHEKRAAGVTVFYYRSVALFASTKKEINKPFGQ